MNLKPRLVDPAKVERIRNRVGAVEKPAGALVPVTGVAAVPEKSEYERKLDDYQVPLLFSMLLAEPKSPRLVELVEDDVRKARQHRDELYEAIFEGILAVCRNDLSEAVRRYHRAFDLADTRDGPPDGFLHSMAWSLFAGSSSNVEVSELLDRARSETGEKRDLDGENAELLRDTAREMRRQSSFMPSLEAYRTAEEDRIRRFHRLLVRPARLLSHAPLLLFPKSSTRAGEDGVFRKIVDDPVFGNYFLFSGGSGTVIDPDASFLDEFYRLGGSLREIRNIVLTRNPSDGVLRQFADVFERFYREDRNHEKLRLFVTSEIVRRFETAFDEMMRRNVVENMTELDGISGQNLSGGDILIVQNGTVVVKIRTAHGTWSTVRFTAPLSESVPDVAVSDGDLVVFAVRTPDDLYWAAGQARRSRCRLLLLDVARESRLGEFEKPLREFLRPEIPFAPVDRSLVCDLRDHRFLDAVEAFKARKETGWTDYRSISWQSESDGFFYFDKEKAEDFAAEKDDILDSFRYHRRRRRGLYFTS